MTIHVSLLRLQKVSISEKADLKGNDQSCRENWFTQFTLTYQLQTFMFVYFTVTVLDKTGKQILVFCNGKLFFFKADSIEEKVVSCFRYILPKNMSFLFRDPKGDRLYWTKVKATSLSDELIENSI